MKSFSRPWNESTLATWQVKFQFKQWPHNLACCIEQWMVIRSFGNPSKESTNYEHVSCHEVPLSPCRVVDAETQFWPCGSQCMHADLHKVWLLQSAHSIQQMIHKPEEGMRTSMYLKVHKLSMSTTYTKILLFLCTDLLNCNRALLQLSIEVAIPCYSFYPTDARGWLASQYSRQLSHWKSVPGLEWHHFSKKSSQFSPHLKLLFYSSMRSHLRLSLLAPSEKKNEKSWIKLTATESENGEAQKGRPYITDASIHDYVQNASIKKTSSLTYIRSFKVVTLFWFETLYVKCRIKFQNSAQEISSDLLAHRRTWAYSVQAKESQSGVAASHVWWLHSVGYPHRNCLMETRKGKDACGIAPADD